MSKKMLIDATHPEETRVAVISGNRLEEYDYENALRKQLKSNIYLVKVTRVEPSLQAAFVDFGGQRHGFLPFPEIHPDYYRIPIADREALIAEERAIAAREQARQDAEDAAELAAEGYDDSEDAEEEGDDNEDASDVAPRPRNSEASLARRVAEKLSADENSDEEDDEAEIEVIDVMQAIEDDKDEDGDTAEASESVEITAEATEESAEASADETTGEDEAHEEAEEVNVDEIGGDTVEAPVYRSSIKRRYKIQEVIKRNQIMLIQISKEERGNKGAAVTSYISLPGRYCVLMPNSPRGGGVSRKVSNAKDRQRLKTILRELNVPEGMSVILRTAGVSRTTAEIKRDLDYLLRLWDEIREFTLKSTAPQLIYEEGNLIKRAIRDLYKRDIDEVHVAGEEGFKTARDFMQMLSPTNVDRVHQYSDQNIPLFTRHQVESQIDAIHSPTVHLRSGGYIVINPTEALVSIDVNSGRATKGRHIEETALKTNLEAAEEVARQLRLRDQGGLVVIDFIDMEDRRANRLVEKKLRDAMAGDRARIQLGRISPFGLLELSRQRLHPSLVETNFETCKHCAGTGLIRTNDTMAVMVLRAIEEEALKGRNSELRVTVPSDTALYIFNHKRDMLASIEKRYNVRVFIAADDKLIKPAFNIDGVRNTPTDRRNERNRPAPVQSLTMGDMNDFASDGESESTDSEDSSTGEEREGREGRNGRRRRGGRNRGRDRDRNRGERPERGERPQRNESAGDDTVADMDDTAGDNDGNDGDATQTNSDGGDERRNRRRGRRGGRRRGGRERGGRGPREGGEGNDGEGRRSAQDNNSGNDTYVPPSVPDSHGNNNGGDNSQEAAAGGSRKGWWKRLTE